MLFESGKYVSFSSLKLQGRTHCTFKEIILIECAAGIKTEFQFDEK